MPAKNFSDQPVLNVLRGQRVDPPPVWFMRQAGRYLPEYRDLRQRSGGFLDMVYTPETAAEITLQPLRRFGMNAAILFSDILVLPHAMGQPLRFDKGMGPVLEPISTSEELQSLSLERAAEVTRPVFETVCLVREALKPEQTLIGFCGGPWTVASYMVAGRGGDEQRAAKHWAYSDPAGFDRLIDSLVEGSIAYLTGQAEAGADCLQIFESWASNLPAPLFERVVISPTRRIVRGVKAVYPDMPVIGFPRGCGGELARYALETGIDAVSLDTGLSPSFVNDALPAGFPVQGNLDPQAVIAGGPMLDAEVRRILDGFADRPHIFNLGHGFVPETPIAHVSRVMELVREQRNV